MATMVDKIQQTYDELPYVSSALPHSTPEHLRSIAHLFGLDAPELENARILELGCASGGNIIPLAIRHPKAKIVGVDLSQVQIEAGQQAIRAMGLGNIRLVQGNITDINDAYGQFDYIICHGVYSWVPEDVREAIFRIAHDRLSPTGMAYISYNVYPGWKAKEIVRDAMLLRGGSRDGVSAKLAYARGMIDFLHDMAAEGSLLKKVMTDNVGMIRHGQPDYIAHEFLELCNAPCYFRDFMAEAGRHGLAYLAEADIPTMFASNYSPEAAEPLLRECGGSQQNLEQLLDFLTNRTFRQTLLVHAERAEQIHYRIDNERIRDFHIAGHFTKQEGETERWRSERGVLISSPSERSLALMQTLTKAWPSTLPVTELLDKADKEDAEHALSFIQQLISAGALRFRLDPVNVQPLGSRLPKAPEPLRKLGKLMSSERMPLYLFNLWHEPVLRMGIVEQKLLPLLDGKHDVVKLSAAVRLLEKKDELNFLHEGQRVVAPDEVVRMANEHTISALHWMRANAMLSA